MFRIAIIGRPNVGKSTLFNRLVGKNYAITDDTPGVTRDRKEAIAKLGPIEFMAIDTAGLENQINKNSLEQRMIEQTEYAVGDSDLCLFVVDGKNGVHPDDIHFANWLRKLEKKTILIANKCENFNEEVFAREFYKLGFGKPLGISAEHKLGFGELYEKIAPEIEKYDELFAELKNSELELNEEFETDFEDLQNQEDQESDNSKKDEEFQKLARHQSNSKNKKSKESLQKKEVQKQNSNSQYRLQIAVIGKPNAGKSTFLNKVLGKERFITGPEAGITRDAIAVDHQFKNHKIRFIDTAGIRKKSNIVAKLEKLSTFDSYRAIRFAQVIILLIDANSLLDHQDLALAGQVLREGRALIFAINKIDSVKRDKESFMREVRKQIQELLPEISGAPIIGVSAKTGNNVEKCLEMALSTYEQWQSRIATNKVNEWLKYAENQHSPKLHKGNAIKLKYASQIKNRPPTFAVFTNHPKPLEGSYKKYLVNSLREYFNLNLTPIRMVLRKSENPFSERQEKTFSKKLHKPKK